MKLLIVIPCYNHNELLYELLNNIRSLCPEDILCIDDGSLKNISIPNNIKDCSLIKNKQNKGKGYSILRASEYAVSKYYTHILVMDSDLQHDPSHIKDFINYDESVDIVYGNRSFDRSMPISRRLSNCITSLLLSVITQVKIHDSQCGYRRYNLELFKQKFSETGYQFESEILIKSLKNNYTIKDLSVNTIYNGNHSNMNYVLDTFKFIRLIIKNIF